MMRFTLAFLTWVLVGTATSHEASAQLFGRRMSARQEMVSPTFSPSMTTSTVASAPTARGYTYSYYTRSTLPARTYVGYGDNDFPFHGAPYGHPYDPYTWAAMSGSYPAEMMRYYAPPLR